MKIKVFVYFSILTMTPKKQDLGNKLEAGRIIAERFRIKRCIGGGGQGTVYLVEDTINNNCEKALKTLRKEVLPQQDRVSTQNPNFSWT